MKKFIVGIFIGIAFLITTAMSFAPNGDFGWGDAIPYRSGALESSHVLKTSAGRVFKISVTNFKSAAVMLMVFDSTTVPADGAVTPVICRPIPALASSLPTNYVVDLHDTPYKFVNGISFAISTTTSTCFTKAVDSGNQFIEAIVW